MIDRSIDIEPQRKEGREEGRKEGREGGREEVRKEGRDEGWKGMRSIDRTEKESLSYKSLKAKEAQSREWAESQMDQLSEEQKVQCNLVKIRGQGVCGRCRWVSGCSLCCFPKAVHYWLNKAKNQKPEPNSAIVYGD